MNRSFAYFVLGATALMAGSADYHVIPFDVDPPIQVDGSLDDWADVPNAIVLNKKENVTYTPEGWQGLSDLSGVIRLAYRYGGLFVAADVTDDVVNQPYRARDIWKGDHLNLWVDLIPGQEPDRHMFGRGQFHVVVSPGNLGGVDGKEKHSPPEIYLYRPEGLKQEGGDIVARRMETGYVIEAFIPWSRLGVKGIKMNQDANFEVAISEADGSPARQERLMTSDTRKWVYSRSRMRQVVFGDGNGRGAPPARGVPITANLSVPALGEEAVSFTVDAIPSGKQPHIFFKARFHASGVTGVRERALYLSLNGEPLGAGRISNRRPRSRFFEGSFATFVAAADGGVGLYYANGFDRPQRSKRYALLDYGPGCEYEFGVEDLLRKGENTLTFRNAAAATPKHKHGITIADVALRLKARVSPPPPPKPAPQGALQVFEPRTDFPRPWANLAEKEAEVTFEVNGERVLIQSRFSAPDGRWHQGSCRFFKHRRKLITRDEWLEVHDTFENVSDDDVPVMQEHTCLLGDRLKKVWLGGYPNQGLNGRKASPQNPSVFGTTERAGVGLFAHSDVFIVHLEMSSTDDGALRLADRQFVLAKGATYTAKWVIVPVAKPDFWAFVNQARRARGVNFTLEHTFAFMSQQWPIYYWTDQQFRDFIDHKSADFVVLSNNLAKVRGRPARCTDLYNANLKPYYDFFNRLRRLYPSGDVKSGVYYHCFLDTTDENAQKFAADRTIDAKGQHVNYGGKGSYMKAYVPTLRRGGWGEEIAKWVGLILDDFKADGVFWDEFTRSRAAYAYSQWDGCTADIDPKTFKIAKKKGSVTLLSLPFRLRQVRRILDRGAPFVINGAPATRTMVEQKFMAFTETGSITNCRKMLLHSPVALGDHLTERVEEDAYRVMLGALDHGCLYSWYAVRIFPTHKTLTEYMFPFTPIELHRGYVIGKERILTNRSGLFGWADRSDFEAHVYDRDGRETKAITIGNVDRGGRTYAEVRIPEGYAVALVRR